MKQFAYNSYGDYSDEATSVIDAIAINNVSNPLAVARTPVDWSTWYSTDGEPLDGSANVSFPNGRPSLLYYQWYGENPKTFATVYIQGAPTVANGIPFRYSASAHGAATLTRNVPRLASILTECSAVFQQANGTELGMVRWQQSIQSN